ncbi:MAG: FAD:protein FMN transferase [Nitrospinota bacterium]|nr:FAD:protein FMN transferase [Nitrospinota bacterium]
MGRRPSPGKGHIRRPTRLEKRGDHYHGGFEAMGSPCSILVETEDGKLAQELLRCVAWEAWRIEAKFSRYRKDSVVWAINASRGARIRVDEETARLLDFSRLCHQLSQGLFDITSGVLGKVWKFDGGDRLPRDEDVQALLPYVGWEKVEWETPYIMLPEGMRIDLGGLGKEYAVDRALSLARSEAAAPMVVNFGGDMAVGGPRAGSQPWIVGVEDPGIVENNQERAAIRSLKSTGGGLATSGDSRRFLLKDGKRYGHVLNPRTGWPVEGAAQSVTVADDSCAKAGMLATLAILQGPGAEEFLEGEGVVHWVTR